MRNIKMVVEYDGSNFKGFQKLKDNENTIQGKLESVLSQMADENIEIIGSGRTDMGVHAYGQVVNFKTNSPLSLNKMHKYLYEYLPQSIAIREIEEVDDRFHSRYNAMGKTYCYTCYVGDKKPVFNRKYVHITGAVPDVEAMKKAASYLVGVHDFASFCGNPKMKKSTVREIYSIDISLKGSYLDMTFHGSGFLQYMVRILSGTLLEVGFGKREADSMQELLEAKNRSLAGATAPAKGLSLLKVHYAN